MSDIFTPEKRSQIMGRICSKNTTPEIAVRQLVHSLGYRFRLHDTKLPSKPDIVLPRHRKVIFVNGCFWHGHNCHLFKWPKSRKEFWRDKIKSNMERDRKNEKIIIFSTWRVLKIWECALKGGQKREHDKLFQEINDWILSRNIKHSISGEEIKLVI